MKYYVLCKDTQRKFVCQVLLYDIGQSDWIHYQNIYFSCINNPNKVCDSIVFLTTLLSEFAS